ncbi:hypothetical protein BJY04DRAFT_223376 [Aspergillus karnatakaensis]|uniref:CVNH domain-containing protein n=1 Tax=Aspergillus karnatakaensis TaxID=1810916 RepID=UPI003CCD5CEF
MHLNISIPLMLLSLGIKVAADSGYGATCQDISYYNAADGSKEIFASCKKISGIYNIGNAINPDSCFANENGRLVGRLWGRYSGSCKDVKLSGTVLRANCVNRAGNYVSTSIETNNWIGNYDGRMHCFGQHGH